MFLWMNCCVTDSVVSCHGDLRPLSASMAEKLLLQRENLFSNSDPQFVCERHYQLLRKDKVLFADDRSLRNFPSAAVRNWPTPPHIWKDKKWGSIIRGLESKFPHLPGPSKTAAHSGHGSSRASRSSHYSTKASGGAPARPSTEAGNLLRTAFDPQRGRKRKPFRISGDSSRKQKKRKAVSLLCEAADIIDGDFDVLLPLMPIDVRPHDVEVLW